jgi:hypothetical protein
MRASLNVRIGLFSALLLVGGAALCSGQSDERLSGLIAQISAAPAVYRTPAAQARFSEEHGFGAAQPGDVQAAKAGLKACIEIAEMGTAGWGAVEILTQRFPQAVHVTSKQATYQGEGSVEDFVATLVMSETNKFKLAPPFFNYDVLSSFEPFLQSSSETARMGNEVTVLITFTFHAGAAALSAITGQPFGTDVAAWRSWWVQNPTMSPAAEAVVPREQEFVAEADEGALGGSDLSTIQLGGVYRIVLRTADEFEGTIEANDGVSLIIETRDRGAFSLRGELVESFELIAPPKSPAPGQSKAVVSEYSFDELLRLRPSGVVLVVHLSSSMTFTGMLASIDASGLKLNVDGSIIPISKEVVVRIERAVTDKLSPVKAMEAAVVPAVEAGPLDTVLVQNPSVDSYGRRGEVLVYAGKITEGKNSITLAMADGSSKEILRSDIVEVRKRSGDSFGDRVKRYAQPLFCPQGMSIVDIPPGKEGRPYFKVCIDKYEYPNREGEQPLGNLSFEQAEERCKAAGKRLCSEEEWQWSCSGLEGYAYPYGWNYDAAVCNTKGVGKFDVSGLSIRCVSKFGVYDMSGNIFEWVRGQDGSPRLAGGAYSKCNTASAGTLGDAKPQFGTRCCTSN